MDDDIFRQLILSAQYELCIGGESFHLDDGVVMSGAGGTETVHGVVI